VDLSGYADLIVFNEFNHKKTASRANVTIMEMDPDESSDIPNPDGPFSRHLMWSR
jgi:hypothetical protein